MGSTAASGSFWVVSSVILVALLFWPDVTFKLSVWQQTDQRGVGIKVKETSHREKTERSTPAHTANIHYIHV